MIVVRAAIVAIWVLVYMSACKGGMPITANPSDHTNAGGTAGSAPMTNSLPPKANNMPLKQDTSIKMPKDTMRRQ